MVVLWALGCGEPDALAPPPDPEPTSAPSEPVTLPEPEPTTPVPEPEVPPDDLEIVYLGVGGWLIRSGGDAILTPPMYSNPDFFETTLGSVESDRDRVEAHSADLPLEEVRGVLVGHAHYDHLLDLPSLWPRMPDATIYGNASVKHVLAAWAPDRAPGCDAPAQPVEIARDRVVQLDDPDEGPALVDFRMCPDLGAGAGEWIAVPGTRVRFRALCSMHPDQLGPIHFGPGDVEEDQCAPPDRADDWREGLTLAFLIDFLDEDGLPVHRIYYQDAPTEVPVGLFAPELLEEKAVDVALMCVGSYPSVPEHPLPSLLLLDPRYTIGGHWEDFFRAAEPPWVPLLGHDIEEYEDRAALALGEREGEGEGEEAPAWVGGRASDQRHWVPDPGTTFLFPPEVGR